MLFNVLRITALLALVAGSVADVSCGSNKICGGGQVCCTYGNGICSDLCQL
jgi:hypothetical protein